jgi:hypothetical protein
VRQHNSRWSLSGPHWRGTGSRHPTWWPRVIWGVGLAVGVYLAVVTHAY